MLDYDALRSRVKKLTEKPDKDPGKLPRTEKETEMVRLTPSSSLHTPIYEFMRARTSMNTSKTQSPGYTELASEQDLDVDLSFPSPPKALQRPEIEKLRRTERAERRKSVTSSRSPSKSGRSMGLRSMGLALGAAPDELMLMRSASAMTSKATDSAYDASFSNDDSSSTRTLMPPAGTPRSVSRSSPDAYSTPTPGVSVTEHDNGRSSSSSKHNRCGLRPSNTPTPFLQPSELEEIMQPFKEEFMQRQADDLAQAKAAYEQLNEQLTNELPQLIDLRYVLNLLNESNIIEKVDGC